MPRPTPFAQDLFCVLLLAILSLTLWIPVLGEASLNPDESQYEATASFLAATDTSAFLPLGAPGMFGLFKIATRLVGPYPIFTMRVLVMMMAFAIAALLFAMVRDEENRWGGLIAGAVFLHGVVPFEGFAVNREWFSSFATILGLGLYVLLRRRGQSAPGWLVVSGFLCGMALWFKLQSSFITLIIPAVLVVEAIGSRSFVRLRRELPWFAAGGLGSGLAYLLPFALNGTLGWFLELMFSDVEVYVGAAEAAARPSYLSRFLVDLPHRPLFLIAYALAAFAAFSWVMRIARPDRRPPRLVLTLSAVYLLFSMICVQLGGRFFAHYYQLMLPAVAVLVGLSFNVIRRRAEKSSPARPAVFVLAAVLIVERFLALRGDALWAGKFRWPADAPSILLVLGLLAVLAYGLQQPLRRAGLGVAALVVVFVSSVVLQEQLAARPISMAHSPRKYLELTARLAAEADAGDRLFVWGWAPEVYSLTRLDAASHITFCQYVTNDIKGFSGAGEINDEWAAMLMEELEATRPRFIVDASRQSWFETDPGVYDLRNYPDFALNDLLEERYRLIGEADNCPIWKRLD